MHSVVSVNKKIFFLARAFAFASLFCAPLSKPGTNIFLLATAITVLFLPDFRARLIDTYRSPIALACVSLFAAFALSALHSPSAYAASTLWAYRLLLLLPLLQLALPHDADRWTGLLAFCAGCFTLLLLSTLAGVGMFAKVTSEVGQFTFSKNYVQQGLAYICAAAIAWEMSCHNRMRLTQRRWLRFAAFIFVAITVLLLEGRTLWPVLIVALLVLAISAWGWRRGVLCALIFIALCAAMAWLSPLASSRWERTQIDTRSVLDGHTDSSWGARAELLRIAFPVIAKAPLFGHGMGSWNQQMHAEAPDRMNGHISVLQNPHQEMLFIASEQGIVGVLAYLFFVFTLLKTASRFLSPARTMFLVVIAVYVCAGLFNAILADFTHRTIFLSLFLCVPRDLKAFRFNT